MHLAYRVLHLMHLVNSHDRLDGLYGVLQNLTLHDGDFIVRRGVAQVHLQNETVQLRFRQRVGPFVLYGIFGGDDEERIW